MKNGIRLIVLTGMTCCSVLFYGISQAGQLDPQFGMGGWVHTDLGGKEQAGTIAVQKDGKLLVGGRIALQTSAYDFLLLRYLPDGNLDTSFAGKGYKIWDFGFSQENLEFVRVLENGKILAGGFSAPNPNTSGILIQLLPDGSEDPDFGDKGFVKFKYGKSNGPVAAAIDSKGRIVVTGVCVVDSFDIDWQVARFTQDGKPDSTFNGKGWMYHNFLTREDIPFDLMLEENGNILISGCAGVYPQANFALLSLLEDGSLNSQFAGTGYLQTDFAGNHDIAYTASLTADGKYLVSGTVRDTVTNYDFALARYLPDGSLDSGFGNGGKMTYDFEGPVDYGLYMLKQKDNKFLVCGENNVLTKNKYVVVRYFDDGRIDSTFGENGIASFNAMSILTDQTPHFAIAPNGKIVMAGNYRDAQNVDVLVIRWDNLVLSGIDQKSKDGRNTLRLISNPINNEIRLEHTFSSSDGWLKLEFFDIKGVEKAHFKIPVHSSQLVLDHPQIKQLPTGWYFIKWNFASYSGTIPVIKK